MQAVADFAKLNYLLSEKKIVNAIVVPQFETCPPMENGERLITEEAIAYLDTCIERETDTKILHTNEAGEYTQERQELHHQIVADEFKHVRCIKRGKPIAVFTGGSPGSGKSRFLEAHADYLLSPDIFHLDADEIRKALPEYQGWNATIAHRETQDIVNELLDEVGHGNCRYDFIYDGTMNKAQKYFKLIQRVKNMGYETFILFMDVPYGVAKKRVLDRYKKTGRFVPSIILDEFFEQLPNGKTRGKDALDQLKAIVDGYLVVDGITGKIIEKGGKSLPKDRSYGDFLEPPMPQGDISADGIEEVTGEPETITETADKKQPAEKQLRALEVSLKFLKGAIKRKAEKQIKGLQLSLKYL
jgi:predicted ABC-type ATPase